MNKQKVKKILMGLPFSFVILGIFALFYEDIFPKSAEFQKVDSLTTPATLIFTSSKNSEEFFYSLDLSSKKQKPVMHFKIRDFPRKGYFETKCSITPDGKKIFILFNDTILEVDTKNYKKTRKLDLNSLINIPKKDPKNTAILENFLVASNSTLWFSRYMESDIFKCKLSSPKKTCKETIYVLGKNNLAMEKYLNKGFTNLTLFSPAPILVAEFEDSNQGFMDLYSYDIIDYEPEKGWLYSSAFLPFKSRMQKIRFLPKRNSKSTFLTKGSCAAWGIDGYIYYIKGNGSLWRFKLEQKQKELVFEVPSKSIDTKFAQLPLVLSNDRKLLAHKFGEKIAIFDLLKKEYIIIKNSPWANYFKILAKNLQD